jgi:hypothetical protein
MARRRTAPAEDRPVRSEPPLWMVNLGSGIARFGSDLVATRQQMRQAQDDWCLSKGCWRPGTKTCEEALEGPCDAQRRGRSRSDLEQADE